MSPLPPWLTLGPVGLERPAAAGWTTVGVLDPRGTARVDAAGLVTPGAARWSLDWWIGAADRWHLPAREPAVRQRRLGAAPVVETALRIPSGDAVHRVWAVRAGADEVVVVEVENASPTPVVLALALRPYRSDGATGSIGSVDLADTAVLVDGRPAVWLPRRPNEAAAAVEVDLVERVQAGRELEWRGPVRHPDGRITAVVVYPLPHRTRVRVVLPLTDPDRGRVVVPASLADHETVVRGWTSVLDAGCQASLPDPALTEQAARSRARLLLDAPDIAPALAALVAGAGTRTAALAAAGHDREALRAVAALADARPGGAADPAAAVEAAGAAALAAGLSDDREAEAAVTEALLDLVSVVDRRRTRSLAGPALAALAAHLRRVGQPEAADRVAARTAEGEDPWAWASPVPSLGSLDDDLTATSSGAVTSPDDPTQAALTWLAMRRLLVVEDANGLALLPNFASRWRGGVPEVHRLPTLFGRLSFAIRWHGYRPALLWELERRPGDPVAALRCPGLDPDWSSFDASGEVLLAGAAQGLEAPPGEGDSFV